MEILLNAGADVNSLDSKHPTPVIAALERNDNLEMQVVIGTIFGRRGNIDIADDEGRRVLHFAADKGLISLLRFLFLFTDDEHPRDNSGSQHLDYAKRNGQEEVAELLLRYDGYFVRR